VVGRKQGPRWPRPKPIPSQVLGGVSTKHIKGGCAPPDTPPPHLTISDGSTTEYAATGGTVTETSVSPPPRATRFHGTVTVDPARVGRDASRIADEVIAHLAGLVGATVKVTLEVEAEIPSGAPDQVVRTVTENSRTLGFNSQGFEQD
jgi:hypothetical protein